MSVQLRNPAHKEDTIVLVPGPDVKQWTDAGWIKVGKSDETPTDPEQNAPRSAAPLDEHPESTDS